MSSEESKPATDRVAEPDQPPLPAVDSAGKVETPSASEPKGPYTIPSRIAVEHNYAKLIPFRSSHSSGSKGSSFSTVVLFADRVGSKLKKKSAKRRKGKHGKGRLGIVEEVQSHGEVSTEEGESSTIPTLMEVERSDHGEAEEIIDVTSVDPVVVLPYDEKKVSSIMVECARHVNLVKPPMDPADSETLLACAFSECDYKQHALLKQLVSILEQDKLARLATASGPHEPIKRRLNTNKAAGRFRKTLATVKWEPKLTRWCHETLLRVLDTNLLPVYLDVLQVLKAKCPVLVEQMIHSSMNMAGGEAFALLLKRPWNPSVGLYSAEKQVKFEPAPIFVSLPYASTGLGGRRWRMWQSQLSIIGKVFPIILPDSLTDMSHTVTLRELGEQMLVCSLQRVQELSVQYHARPIVLIGFSIASRIAAKIAEVLPVALIVSLGLPSTGVDHKWKVSSDPFKDCRVPTFFAVGSEGRVSTIAYAEKIRGKMKTPTSLVVVGGGDDLLRLSLADKQMEDITQSIVDRLVLEEIMKFMVHILPCSFNFPEDQHRSLPRKRKAVHAEEIGSMFLTPVLSQSPIILTPSPEDALDGKNYNFNNSSPFWRSFLKQGGRISPGGSLSSSPSPIALLERRFLGENAPAAKRIAAELMPKQGRPRSSSTATDKSKKKAPLRSRSKSSDQAAKKNASEESKSTSTLNTFAPIAFTPEALTSNTNSNNNASPPGGGMLKIPVPHFRPLPITPPRNPYEDQPIMDRQLDPKTLRYLQLNK